MEDQFSRVTEKKKKKSETSQEHKLMKGNQALIKKASVQFSRSVMSDSL